MMGLHWCEVEVPNFVYLDLFALYLYYYLYYLFYFILFLFYYYLFYYYLLVNPTGKKMGRGGGGGGECLANRADLLLSPPLNWLFPTDILALPLAFFYSFCCTSLHYHSHLLTLVISIEAT